MKIKTITIDADVEAVLRSAELDGNNLTLNGQLTSQMYKKVMKILEQIGFKWNRSAKCHIGEGDSADRFREALDVGKVVNEKQTYQFFATPSKIADRLVSLSGIGPGDRVLEPSAGRGAIIDAIWRCSKSEVPPVLFAVEIDPKNVKFLKDRNAESKDSSLCVTEQDFLDHTEQYDRIVMNPPFTCGQDIDHVRHAYNLLLPGGRLTSVMSPSWQHNDQRKARDFREWLDEMVNEGRAYMEELPAGTFSESGTDIKTVIVTVQKPLSQVTA